MFRGICLDPSIPRHHSTDANTKKGERYGNCKERQRLEKFAATQNGGSLGERCGRRESAPINLRRKYESLKQTSHTRNRSFSRSDLFCLLSQTSNHAYSSGS